MMRVPSGRPAPSEYSDFQQPYVSKVPEDDPLAPMSVQPDELAALLSVVSEHNAGYRYAPGKWSIRQTIGHLSDTERILSYRAVCIARGEQGSLLAFDEDAYVAHAAFDDRTFEDLTAEFVAVRASTRHLFRHLDRDAWLRIGTANGKPISVRALVYVIVGHARHHMGILGERYLPGLSGVA